MDKLHLKNICNDLKNENSKLKARLISVGVFKIIFFLY